MIEPRAPSPEAHRRRRTETPGWVIAFGLVTLALVIAFAAIHLAGGGFHHHMGP